MTVESTDNRAEYTGNGSTTEFSFPYLFLSESDLVVLLDSVEQTLDSDYTVTGAEDPNGGTVEFTTAPADGADVIIFRDPEILQPFDLVENDSLPAEEAERAWDRITLVAQRLRELVSRSFRLSDAVESGVDVQVPAPEASTLIGWNADGDALTNREVQSLDGVMIGTAPDEVPTNADLRVNTLSDLQALNTTNARSIYMLGRSSVGDGGEGHFRWDSSDLSTEVGNDEVTAGEGDGGIYVATQADVNAGTPGQNGAWVRQRSSFKSFNSAWYGLDENTADASPILAHIASVLPSTGGEIITPPGDYTIASSIDFNVPEDTHVYMHGARFTFTHDGQGFILNSTYDPSDATPATKRRVYFHGGEFRNTNGAKTASEAIRAYGMRMFTCSEAYFEGFYHATVVSAKDTYIFSSCYWFNNSVHLYVPSIGTRARDTLLQLELNNCHFSVVGDTNGILVEDAVKNFIMTGGSLNGDCSAGQILFKDNSLVQTENIKINDVHFEQSDSNGCVVFSESNGNGFRDVKIRGDFVFQNTGAKAIILDHVRGYEIDSYFRNGSGDSSGVKAIEVDADSRDGLIHHGANFVANPARFLGMDTPIVIASGARQHIAGIPSLISQFEAGVLSGFGPLDTFSDVSETTIDMRSKITRIAKWPLPPRGYMISINAEDTGSAAAVNCFAAIRNGSGGGSNVAGLLVALEGVPDSTNRQANGFAPSDENGDISYRILASGTDTMTFQIVVNGAVF